MTNNARIGGILSIVAGGIGCVGALIMVLFAIIVGIFGGTAYYDYNYDYPGFGNTVIVMAVIYGVIAFIGLIVSALAIIGGVFALRRRNWGLALAGSIAAALAFFPCGIAAIIFTVIGRQEFDAVPPVAPRV